MWLCLTPGLVINVTTGRYDTKELLVRSGTDLFGVLTSDSPHVYKEHKISVSVVSSQVTRVSFKGVPINVPGEELLHLCSCYGDLTDGKVHRAPIRLGGSNRHTITSSHLPAHADPYLIDSLDTMTDTGNIDSEDALDIQVSSSRQ